MKVFPGRIELGKDELERNEHAHGHADDAPENRGQGEGPNNAGVVWFGADLRIHEPVITPLSAAAQRQRSFHGYFSDAGAEVA